MLPITVMYVYELCFSDVDDDAMEDALNQVVETPADEEGEEDCLDNIILLDEFC